MKMILNFTKIIFIPLILSKRNSGFLNNIKNKIQNDKDLEVYNPSSFFNHFIDISSIVDFIIRIILDQLFVIQIILIILLQKTI